jgi:hypothetical protein
MDERLQQAAAARPDMEKNSKISCGGLPCGHANEDNDQQWSEDVRAARRLGVQRRQWFLYGVLACVDELERERDRAREGNPAAKNKGTSHVDRAHAHMLTTNTAASRLQS